MRYLSISANVVLDMPEMRLPILLVLGSNPSVIDYEQILRVLLVGGFREMNQLRLSHGQDDVLGGGDRLLNQCGLFDANLSRTKVKRCVISLHQCVARFGRR